MAPDPEKQGAGADADCTDDRRFEEGLRGTAKELLKIAKQGKGQKAVTSMIQAEDWFKQHQQERLELERKRLDMMQSEMAAAREQREAMLRQAKEAAEMQLIASQQEREMFRDVLLRALGGAAGRHQ